VITARALLTNHTPPPIAHLHTIATFNDSYRSAFGLLLAQNSHGGSRKFWKKHKRHVKSWSRAERVVTRSAQRQKWAPTPTTNIKHRDGRTAAPRDPFAKLELHDTQFTLRHMPVWPCHIFLYYLNGINFNSYEIVMANWRCKNIKNIVPRSRFAAKVKPLQRQSHTLIIICTHKLMCKYVIKYSIKGNIKISNGFPFFHQISSWLILQSF